MKLRRNASQAFSKSEINSKRSCLVKFILPVLCASLSVVRSNGLVCKNFMLCATDKLLKNIDIYINTSVSLKLHLHCKSTQVKSNRKNKNHSKNGTFFSVYLKNSEPQPQKSRAIKARLFCLVFVFNIYVSAVNAVGESAKLTKHVEI